MTADTILIDRIQDLSRAMLWASSELHRIVMDSIDGTLSPDQAADAVNAIMAKLNEGAR
jgi:hypothetical protein